VKFLETDIAKKYDLISLNLDAKNSIKNGRVSFVGFGSVLDGYFGIPYIVCQYQYTSFLWLMLRLENLH
jgi:hypothetical protein